MAASPGIISRIRQAFGGKVLPELDPRLAAMEKVFRAPPLTPELINAIRLISPHCDLAPTERHRQIWEADQNGACWGEYETLSPLLHSMRPPKRILEIGPGMGRSLTFFSKRLGWHDRELHAYEGEGDTTKYTLLGPRFEDSFCGNIGVLRSVLDYNGIRNVTIHNARTTQFADLPGPFDLLYSFYSIGFHWSLEHFLDDLLPLLHDDSVAVFTVTPQFKPFASLESLAYRVVEWKPAWPKNLHLKMLMVGKRSLPKWKIAA